MSSLMSMFGWVASYFVYRSWYPKSPNSPTRSVTLSLRPPEAVLAASAAADTPRTTRTAASVITRRRGVFRCLLICAFSLPCEFDALVDSTAPRQAAPSEPPPSQLAHLLDLERPCPRRSIRSRRGPHHEPRRHQLACRRQLAVVD